MTLLCMSLYFPYVAVVNNAALNSLALRWFHNVGGAIPRRIPSLWLAFVIAPAAHKFKSKPKTFEVLYNLLFTNISWFFKNLLIDNFVSTAAG